MSEKEKTEEGVEYSDAEDDDFNDMLSNMEQKSKVAKPTNDKIRTKEIVNAVKYRTVIKDGVEVSERIEV